METQQLQKLKINSTNIKSSLISYNKQLRKLRLDENKLLKDREKKAELQDKEKRLEMPGKSLIENIKSRIIAGPMSFFDKIKEFFGIVLIGLVINNLPAIVNKASEVGTTLVNVTSSIIKVIETAVNGVTGFISIIQSLPETTKSKLIESKNQLEKVILDLNSIVDPEGMKRSYEEYDKKLRSQSSGNNNGQNSGSGNEPPVQGKRRGGTIKRPISKSSLIDAPKLSNSIKGTEDQKVTTSPYSTKSGTPKLRRARQAYNAFGNFYNLSQEHKITNESLGLTVDNINNVNDSVYSFLTELRTLVLGKPFKTTSINDPTSQTPITTTGPTSTVPIDTNDVIGTVGSTGYVTGPHIHIERVGDYTAGIPNNVKDNILIEGVPMPQKLIPTDMIGNYNWRKSTRNPTGLHKGEDWSGSAGQKITLTGGLKFLQFMPDSGSGYGNQVYIQAPDGTQYTLNHLDSGPVNLQELLKRQKRQQQIMNMPVSPNQVPPGQQGPVIPLTTSFRFDEEEDDVQIVMVNTVQQVIQQKTRTVMLNSGGRNPFPQSAPTPTLSGIWNA